MVEDWAGREASGEAKAAAGLGKVTSSWWHTYKPHKSDFTQNRTIHIVWPHASDL